MRRVGLKRPVPFSAGVLLVTAAAFAAPAIAAAGPSVPGGAGGPGSATGPGLRTQTRIFRAFTAAGQPAIHVTSAVRGSCFTASSAIDRADAWRCISGNLLYDPCFSSQKAKGIVVCPVPWKSSGTEIKLTKPLPMPNRGKPSTSVMPWAVQTGSGLDCVINTGTGNTIHGMRSNYGCVRSSTWLWGSPSRKSQPWTIYAARLNATKLTRRVKIVTAWF